jgi:hypothetical protein
MIWGDEIVADGDKIEWVRRFFCNDFGKGATILGKEAIRPDKNN